MRGFRFEGVEGGGVGIVALVYTGSRNLRKEAVSVSSQSCSALQLYDKLGTFQRHAFQPRHRRTILVLLFL